MEAAQECPECEPLHRRRAAPHWRREWGESVVERTHTHILTHSHTLTHSHPHTLTSRCWRWCAPGCATSPHRSRERSGLLLSAPLSPMPRWVWFKCMVRRWELQLLLLALFFSSFLFPSLSSSRLLSLSNSSCPSPPSGSRSVAWCLYTRPLQLPPQCQACTSRTTHPGL